MESSDFRAIRAGRCPRGHGFLTTREPIKIGPDTFEGGRCAACQGAHAIDGEGHSFFVPGYGQEPPTL
jgi:hypothetical protein